MLQSTKNLAAGHDPVRYLQEMAHQMNEMTRSAPSSGQQSHPLQRRLDGGGSTSSPSSHQRDRLNLGEHATASVPLAPPQFSTSPRLQSHANSLGQSHSAITHSSSTSSSAQHQRHRISGKIDEEDEAEEDARDKRLDAMMNEADRRDSARKLHAKSTDNDELSFQLRNAHIKLQELEEECMRYGITLQSEIKEKRKLELRNADLSSKLADARQGLRDTQAALTNVQQATEQLIQKRDQRDTQLQRVLAENKMYESRVYELETSQRNAESAVKTLTSNRDELIDKLQSQLGEAQDAFFKAQSECVRHKGDKTMLEAELEQLKRKITTVEMKSKQMENNLHATYTAEIDRLEDRLRIFADKVEEGRAQESRANDLQAEIRSKMNDLKNIESKLMQSENLRKEQDIRQQSLEAQLRSSELQHRQLDMRHRNLEQEFARVNQELSAFKRVKGQAEEDMREVALQNAQLLSDKQELRQALNTLEGKLEGFSEAQEMCKRQKRELERANHQLDEAGRRIIDLERNHRILSDDCVNTEARIKGITQRMAGLLARDGENRQIIIVANNRITELYNLARDLHTKYLQEELRADRLEKDFTGVAPKRPYASMDVPYAAAPVVPLPMPMDSGSTHGPAQATPDYSPLLTVPSMSSTPRLQSIGGTSSTVSLSLSQHLASASPAAFASHIDALRPTPPTGPRSSASQERPLKLEVPLSSSAPGTATTVASRGSTGESLFASPILQQPLGPDFLASLDDDQ